MSLALYEKMRERWIDFLNAKVYLEEPEDEIHLANMYDDLAEKFCKEHGYSEKTLEFAFHGRWWDTFADLYYQELEKNGWEGFTDIQASTPSEEAEE